MKHLCGMLAVYRLAPSGHFAPLGIPGLAHYCGDCRPALA